ncbi:hypothetical protein SARC_01987 [Sphaeroforma arctica JP610]|uniref:Uncharacterized protein n=1 Tax=Sphaeroforma arctica JP610 TaxID=667725 RepID=A0A0L0GAD2_9EUKA|nr:hypothetical protein SARC_01987 [Sphaeroforma arctica JP610]KNC85841.1 hypothetical protein SARC_01987 [Sphaeroforma arctica JP610]|eukprot:XP_014159743.1 hypothetical protein SARC_01987 [Sphaeroforma arctica JP610]
MKSKYGNKKDRKAKTKNKPKSATDPSSHPPARISRSDNSMQGTRSTMSRNDNGVGSTPHTSNLNRKRRPSLTETGMESLRETVFNISMLVMASALLLLFLYVVNELREDDFDRLDS